MLSVCDRKLLLVKPWWAVIISPWLCFFNKVFLYGTSVICIVWHDFEQHFMVGMKKNIKNRKYVRFFLYPRFVVFRVFSPTKTKPISWLTAHYIYILVLSNLPC